MSIEKAKVPLASDPTTKSRVLQLDPRDNVLVALTDLGMGERIRFLERDYVLSADVPAKHKFVTEQVAVGGEIIMYGVLVGKATEALQSGDLLATRNLRHAAREFHETERVGRAWTPPDVSAWRNKTFAGYHRADGQVGSRNYWIVVPLVFCENRNLAVLKQAFEEELGFAAPQVYRRQVRELVRLYREGKNDELKSFSPSAIEPGRPSARVFRNVDGIKFLMHEGGCGGTREDANNLCGLLAGYIHHPNVAGATVLSLGCQHSQVDILREQLFRRDSSFSKPLLVFEQQQCGSEATMLSAATRETFLAMAECNNATRAPVPLAKLCVGLKCGGSDGFSGLTANPALGHVSDTLTALGATTILSEFPELCGVEQELIDRCKDDSVADRFVRLMNDYAARARAGRSAFAMNPSPGNIK